MINRNLLKIRPCWLIKSVVLIEREACRECNWFIKLTEAWGPQLSLSGKKLETLNYLKGGKATLAFSGLFIFLLYALIWEQICIGFGSWTEVRRHAPCFTHDLYALGHRWYISYIQLLCAEFQYSYPSHTISFKVFWFASMFSIYVHYMPTWPFPYLASTYLKRQRREWADYLGDSEHH